MLLTEVTFEKYVGTFDKNVEVCRLREDVREDGRFLRRGLWVLLRDGVIVDSDKYFNDLSERNNFQTE